MPEKKKGLMGQLNDVQAMFAQQQEAGKKFQTHGEKVVACEEDRMRSARRTARALERIAIALETKWGIPKNGK